MALATSSSMEGKATLAHRIGPGAHFDEILEHLPQTLLRCGAEPRRKEIKPGRYY